MVDQVSGDSLKVAAPNNSPTASPNVPPFNAAKVEKTSGDPFPKARKVTPAVLSLSPSTAARVARLGQKKSEAEMPINENRNDRIRTRAANINGLPTGDASRYH